MKLYVIDRTPSAMRLSVQELERYFIENGMKFEMLDADAASTTQKLTIYDIVSFPAILVTRDDGQLVKMWQGGLPMYAEIQAAYGITTN